MSHYPLTVNHSSQASIQSLSFCWQSRACCTWGRRPSRYLCLLKPLCPLIQVVTVCLYLLILSIDIEHSDYQTTWSLLCTRWLLMSSHSSVSTASLGRIWWSSLENLNVLAQTQETWHLSPDIPRSQSSFWLPWWLRDKESACQRRKHQCDSWV